MTPAILRPSDEAYSLERFDVAQASAYLGLHRKTLYRLVEEQQIGCRRLGERGRLKFSQADLDQWRELHRVDAVLTPKQARRERLTLVDAPGPLKLPRQRMFGA